MVVAVSKSLSLIRRMSSCDGGERLLMLESAFSEEEEVSCCDSFASPGITEVDAYWLYAASSGSKTE